MKKLFALVLIFALLLSGCGRTEEPVVVEPNEEPSEIENSETEEISEEFVEEIILNFGAEKLENGTYCVTEPFSFYRGTGKYEDFKIIDTSANSLYGMGAMLEKEYIEEIYVSNLRYKVYNAENFENMVYKYFGISAEVLKNTIHYNEFEELDGAGYYWLDGPYYIDENPSVTLENFEKNTDSLIVNLKVDYEKEADVSGVLTVKLLPEGGYNYISYVTEKIEGTEPEEIVSMTFKLGSKGETVELFPGDSIGEWVLTKLDVDYNPETDWTDSIEAEFSGNVELKGHIERNVMAELAYDFVVDRSEFDRMPFLVSKDFKEFRGNFVMNIPEGLENSPNLDWNESLPCKITISGFSISCAYTETFDRMDVLKIEPLPEEIPALYEEMILNFGAVYNYEGKLAVRKGVSLYNNREGYMDCSLMGPASYYSWVMSRTSTEDRIEVSLPGFTSKVYAYDAEFFENMVSEYFETSAEYLRNSDFYYPEQNCYFIDGGVGIGDTTYIQYLFAEEKDDKVIIYFNLSDNYYGVSKHALTVKLLPDGGYNYVSYLPE